MTAGPLTTARGARSGLHSVETVPDGNADAPSPEPLLPRLSPEEIAALHRLIEAGRLTPEILGLPGLGRACGRHRTLALAAGLVVWGLALYGAWSLLG